MDRHNRSGIDRGFRPGRQIDRHRIDSRRNGGVIQGSVCMNYESKDGINIKKWRTLREYILARDNYLDQVAKRYGKRIEADQVHHIFPREYFPEYIYEPWNLIAVSTRTHNTLHDRETHKLTVEGWKLLERTARKNGIDVSPGLREAITAIGNSK